MDWMIPSHPLPKLPLMRISIRWWYSSADSALWHTGSTVKNGDKFQGTKNGNQMAPLDPLGLAWVWFSELVRSQVPCHPNFLMIFGNLTHASPRSIWNTFEINLSIPILDWFWCIPSSVFCVVQPCRFFYRKTRPWCFCSLNQCFWHSTKTILNGTRLDSRGLKS